MIKGFMLNRKSVARREYVCNTLFTIKKENSEAREGFFLQIIESG